MNFTKIDDSKSVLSIIYPNKNEQELELIGYGTKLIAGTISKVVILLFAAYILGIFKYTLFSLITFNIIRFFASGVHARSYISCLLSTFLIFSGSVYLAQYIHFSRFDMVVSFSLCLFLAYLYAPADTEERPIMSAKLRKKLKVKSIASILAGFVFSMCFSESIYSEICTITMLTECILICPLTYKILNRRYNNYEFIKRKKEFQ